MIAASNWPRLKLGRGEDVRIGGRPAAGRGAVAQLGERLICIQEVAGSIPTSSTSGWLLAKPMVSVDEPVRLVAAEAEAERGSRRALRGVKPQAIGRHAQT
jgi:hypothetical protein